MQTYLKNNSIWIVRISLFIVYFWFGVLKVLGFSPAHDLVGNLLQETIPFIPEEVFVIGLGLFEMLIGLMFLVKRLEKPSFYLTVFHLFMTSGPLVFLPAISWQGILIPTLVGQYILKNFLIFACAVVVFTSQPEEKQI